MQQLLQMYLGTLPLQLQPADRVDLISALAFVVSQMEFAHCLPAMSAIAQPLLDRLSALLQQPSPAPATDVATLLEQICALLRGVQPGMKATMSEEQIVAAGGHPSVQMLLKIWDVLAAVSTRHGASSNCMEKLCRCYKHTARTAGDSFRAVVGKLLPLVTGWFEQQPHSCFLYINNVCLTAFGRSPAVGELLPLFSETFRRMAVATFQLLSATSTLVDNPDVVDDFFELCGKVLIYQVPPLDGAGLGRHRGSRAPIPFAWSGIRSEGRGGIEPAAGRGGGQPYTGQHNLRHWRRSILRY